MEDIEELVDRIVEEWLDSHPGEKERLRNLYAELGEDGDATLTAMGWLEPRIVDGEMVHTAVKGDNPCYLESMARVEHALGTLTEKGLIDMHGVDEDGEVVYQITPAGIEVAKGLRE